LIGGDADRAFTELPAATCESIPEMKRDSGSTSAQWISGIMPPLTSKMLICVRLGTTSTSTTSNGRAWTRSMNTGLAV